MTNKYNYFFGFSLISIVVILLWILEGLSISYKEALNLFVNNSVLSLITRTSISLFGQNDFALRLPFLILYIFSVILMYKLTQNYFRYEKDRLISIIIFMILPGMISASLLVNSAILIIFCLLLYLYLYEKYQKHNYLLLLLLLFIDNSIIIFYLALFFYSLKNKETKAVYLSLLLFLISVYIYGIPSGGKPKGFLVDTFAFYATIFSPLLFIYFLYSIYRRGIENKRDLTWYISVSALVVSILFSIRQRIYIEDFAPYVIISIPFMLKRFFHSYRVRLKIFRKKHLILASLIIFMLVMNVLVTMFNKSLYLFLENPKKHFAYQYHFAKDIAKKLKEKNIDEIYSDDKTLDIRLRFYNIKTGTKYFITESKPEYFDDVIKISYYNVTLKNLYIIKK